MGIESVSVAGDNTGDHIEFECSGDRASNGISTCGTEVEIPGTKFRRAMREIIELLAQSAAIV
jgi:hypothetical protein